MTKSVTATKAPDEALVSSDDEFSRQDDGAYFTTTLTVMGFALYWACVLVILFSSTLGPSYDRPMDGFLLRFVFLLGFCMASIAVGPRYTAFTDNRSVRNFIRVLACAMVAAIGVFAIAESVGMHAPTGFYAILWLLLGFSMSQMLHFWGYVWKGIDADRSENSFCSTCIAGSVLLAPAICLFMLFAPPYVGIAATLVACVASAVLQQLCGRRLPDARAFDESAAVLGAKPSREMAAPLAALFAFGVTLALSGLRLGAATAFPLTLFGVGAGSLIVLGIIKLRGKTPRASSFERVTFPILGCCLLVLPHAHTQVAYLVVSGIILIDATSYLVFHWNALVVLAYRLKPHPVQHFGRGIVATSLGIALGWGFVAVPVALRIGEFTGYGIDGWATAVPAALTEGGLASIGLVPCLLSVMLLMVAASISPYASSSITEPLFGSSEPAWSPMGDTDSPLVESYVGFQAAHDIACAQLCDECALTPREREVFALLARGRNAEHIGKQLFISIHTTKTHMSRIYRKMGINSQQQLIDMVDERKGELTVCANKDLR